MWKMGLQVGIAAMETTGAKKKEMSTIAFVRDAISLTLCALDTAHPQSHEQIILHLSTVMITVTSHSKLLQPSFCLVNPHFLTSPRLFHMCPQLCQSGSFPTTNFHTPFPSNHSHSSFCTFCPCFLN